MKKIVFVVALALLSSVAVAKSKGTPTPQNHSCILNDAVVQKTKKECIKAGGKWEKNSASTAKPAESKTATPAVAPVAPVAPTPAPAPAPAPK
jgi:hypothetical protein